MISLLCAKGAPCDSTESGVSFPGFAPLGAFGGWGAAGGTGPAVANGSKRSTATEKILEYEGIFKTSRCKVEVKIWEFRKVNMV